METFSNIVFDFFDKFLGQAPLLLGTVVLLGYLLLRKPWYDAVAGFIKTYVGFRILQVGTGGLVGTFRPIIDAIYDRFEVSASLIGPYYGQTSGENVLENFGSLQFVAYVMLIAFIFNIILVALKKHTKIRTLFLTGHIMYQQSVVLLWALFWVIDGGQGEVGWFLMLVTGVLVGTYWSVASNLVVEATNDVTDGAGFSIGHQQMFGAWLAYKVAAKIGDRKKDVNDMELPGWLSILNDNVVANVVIMTLFIGTLMVIIGPGSFDYDEGSYYWGTYIFETTSLFAVYITIIITGVRMFVAELTNSFQGISDKLLPGSVPAVDCAVTFGFSPNAPAWGFMFGFAGQLLAIGALILFNSPILIIAGFIPLFFDNGTLAVFANKAGGRLAAAVIPFFAGLLQVFGSALVLNLLIDAEGVIGWMGMFDWATVFSGATLLASVFGIIIPILMIPLLLVIPQLQYRRHKENYYTTMMDETVRDEE